MLSRVADALYWMSRYVERAENVARFISVNLHLMPAKGMTLPFVSYGGSSLISLAYGMGMLIALTRERPRGHLSPDMTLAARTA